MKRSFITCMALIALIPSFLLAYPFFDNAESGTGQFLLDSPWGLTNSASHSPTHAFTDSPLSNYANGVDLSLTQAAAMDLSLATDPVLSFWHRYTLEDGYDIARVEVSTDNGASWDPVPLASYTGSINWSREQLSLSAYNGLASVTLRFRLTSDATVNMDGWTIDDIRVDEAPSAVSLSNGSVTPTTVALSWTESSASDFSAYRIYRSTSAGFDWRTATLVETITEKTSTSTTDITASPKRTFHYRVMVLTTNELHSLSNEIQVVTPAGIDFPFLDNGEAGAGLWSLGSPWALTEEGAESGTWSYSDSPGGDYTNSITSQSMVLATSLDLSTSTAPILAFHHIYAFLAGDFGFVEVSTNGGSSWTTLLTFTNNTVTEWSHAQADLTPYRTPNVMIRFRITTDASGTADGWHIDNISVSEQPTVVPSPFLSNVTSHTIDMAWDQNTDGNFSHYAIHRSTATGVSAASPLAGTVDQQTTTTFTDLGLALNTWYYYRVYAVNQYGAYSPDSASESSTKTLNNPLPFYDSFEGDLDNWWLTGGWSATDVVSAHGGTWCLQDSPGFYTDSSDTSATTSVDLTGTARPVLTFWDRFAFETNNDWGVVEVSTNGTTWIRRYSVTGTRDPWARQQIDLSEWKGQPDLRIRFAVRTNGCCVVADGWYIDDVAVEDLVLPVFTPPFTEDFESGLGNWLRARWTEVTDDPHGGTTSLRSTPEGNTYPSTPNMLDLAGTLDLSSTTSPQMTYWVRGHLEYHTWFRVYASTNDGVSWAEVSGSQINYYWRYDSTWTRYQLDLSTYKTYPNLRLRIQTHTDGSGADEDIWIDDIRIEDLPASVVLDPPVPHLKTIDLSWSASGLGDFWKYEVYRSTSPSVSLSSTKIGEFTNVNTLAMTDTGLDIGTTYYYKVFVYNTYGTTTPSNERSATTVSITIPFLDPMENLNSWVATGTWGVTDEAVHGGTFSVTDSPFANYADSSDTSIVTAVNLIGTNRPVLTFWDRFAFETNGDWGVVEVSTNGTTWIRRYSVTGIRDPWARQQIDLSEWKGQPNLRIRFAVRTNSSVVPYDGWYIDDVAVEDLVLPVFTPPFTEDFESGLGNWLRARWTEVTDDPHGGTTSLRSTPEGNTYPSTPNMLDLAGTLDLSSTTSPQMTYWVRGHLEYHTWFRVYASTNDGVSWAEVSGSQINYYWRYDSTWTRYQLDLSTYKTYPNLRLRIQTHTDGSGADEDIWIDDIRIEETPTPVTLFPPDSVTTSTMHIDWTEYAGGDFKQYELYRHTSTGVTLSHTLIAVITDQGTTDFSDTGLQLRRTYYYKVYVRNIYDTMTPSNEASATTLGWTMGEIDTFETPNDRWILEGGWTRLAGVGYEGSTALVDSIGDYPSSSDSLPLTATTGVDLSTSVWPILVFKDRHTFELNNDWGVVEVSTNLGGGWTRVYSVTGTRNEWREARIDLSPFKPVSQVWIRFRTTTNGCCTVADGWLLDDVTIMENPHVPIAYPYQNSFEEGLVDFLNSHWSTTTDQPKEGATAVVSTPGINLYPSTELWLNLAGEMDLSSATNPSLHFWVRGHLGYHTWFRVQVSTNGGISWSEIASCNLNYYWTSDTTWVKLTADLSSFRVPGVRFRFRANTDGSGADEEMVLDAIRFGEPEPTAPQLYAPTEGTIVNVLRPTLEIVNAFDPQFDPLTYRYEVYSDGTLTTLVAQVPAVAEGSGITGWTLDVNLADNAQYWWRCRANDGTLDGPWMETASFYVHETNTPPLTITIAGPPNGATLWGPEGALSWYPTTDPDVGDTIDSYHIQADDDPSFASPEINDETLVPPDMLLPQPTIAIDLGSLAGYSNLNSEIKYYWRIRATDSRGLSSAWTNGTHNFIFILDANEPEALFTSPTNGETITNTPVSLTGTAIDDGGVNFVEVSTNGGTSWDRASGVSPWSSSWSVNQNGIYNLLARATDQSGKIQSSPDSITVTVAIPTIPVNLQAVAGNTIAFLRWNAVPLSNVLGYNVHVSSTSMGPYLQVNTLMIEETEYLVTGLTNGESYYLTVTTILDGEAESGYAEEIEVVPNGPGDPSIIYGVRILKALPDDVEIHFYESTTDPGTGVEPCDHYNVYGDQNPDFIPDIPGHTNLVTSSSGSPAFHGGALNDDLIWFYRITAVDSLGNESDPGSYTKRITTHEFLQQIQKEAMNSNLSRIR
ncbi:MAG TPA: immune inhibitor A [Thermoanaerobaculia bacterium]|nr:immune inhibitor A [Thermoanaerobaculia bacterium]